MHSAMTKSHLYITILVEEYNFEAAYRFRNVNMQPRRSRHLKQSFGKDFQIGYRDAHCNLLRAVSPSARLRLKAPRTSLKYTLSASSGELGRRCSLIRLAITRIEAYYILSDDDSEIRRDLTAMEQSKYSRPRPGFVEPGTNTSWTNTVNELVRSEVLEAAYQQWANSVNVTVGDTLVFDYVRGQHTVFLAKTELAYTNCNFSLGSVETISDAVPATYTIKQTDGTLYFTCTVPGHCEGGQKVKIKPFGTTGTDSTPDAAPAPSNAPQHPNLSAGTIVMLLFVCSFTLFIQSPWNHLYL